MRLGRQKHNSQHTSGSGRYAQIKNKKMSSGAPGQGGQRSARAYRSGRTWPGQHARSQSYLIASVTWNHERRYFRCAFCSGERSGTPWTVPLSLCVGGTLHVAVRQLLGAHAESTVSAAPRRTLQPCSAFRSSRLQCHPQAPASASLATSQLGMPMLAWTTRDDSPPRRPTSAVPS